MAPSSTSSTSSHEELSPVSTAPSTPPIHCEHLEKLRFQDPYRSAYARWRPSYHLLPGSGWLNDPCAPCYDAVRDRYVLSFQYNPRSPDWGSISWGTAISHDLVNWTPYDDATLSPGKDGYDDEGVFTGCHIPTNDGMLTVAYTSVNRLPIHYTLPHVQGSESLSLAKSHDGGRSWVKVEANPILPCEPEGIEVTGWRDPFVSQWPSMAGALSLPTRTLFGCISGGLRDITPTTFLYAIKPDDETRWEYIGPLTNVGLNLRPSRWSGDLGINWEVTNFLNLADDEDPYERREYLIMGTEGCLPTDSPHSDATRGPARPLRNQLWMCGSLQQKDNTNACDPVSSLVEMKYSYGGYFDHGCLYAVNSFHDPISKKQIGWGWIPEDDLANDLRHAQGWSGMLSLPREIRMQTIHHVVRALATPLEEITNIETQLDNHGTFTLRTLGCEPLDSVQTKLHQRAGVRNSQLESIDLDQLTSMAVMDVYTKQWALKCSLQLSPACRRIGVVIGHDTEFHQRTTLSFAPAREMFYIERPTFVDPGQQKLVNSTTEQAPHTLFTCRDPTTKMDWTETLDINVWMDNSVMEVFINGRTAITTRIYAAERTCRIRFFADDGIEGGRSKLMCASLWDGVGCD